MNEGIAAHLLKAGFKLTPPRLAVLQVLEESEEHLSHAEVLERGKLIYPGLGRATVYRTLDLLVSLGVLRPIYLGDQSICFTRADVGHHHLICSECGVVIEFEECVIDELHTRLAEELNFQVRGHLLELYGLCGRCQDG